MSRLPFERGTTTSSAGALGDEFYDPSRKQWLQVVKNTDAAALKAKRYAKWETPASYEVDYAIAAQDFAMAAGIVDPVLGSATVPINAYCFLVTEGLVTADVGSGTDLAAVGNFLIIATTAIAANKGKVGRLTAVAGAVGLLTAEVAANRQIIGVSYAGIVSADSTNSVEMKIALRK